MNKKTNLNQQKQQARDYKKMLKRMWICVGCLIPVILLITYAFAVFKFPVWLAIFLNVVIGGFICLLVYIIFDKIEEKKRLKNLLEPNDEDPFSN